MNIFNKGKRTFVLKEGKNFLPNTFKDIDDDEAKKLLKNYPREVVKSQDYVDPNKRNINNEKLVKKIKELEEDKNALSDRIKELEEKNQKLVAKLKANKDK